MISNLFRRRSLAEIMDAELADAQRALLEARTARDYANAMVKYHEDRIQRLEAGRRLRKGRG